MPLHAKLEKMLDELITDGSEVLKTAKQTEYDTWYLDLRACRAWEMRLKLFKITAGGMLVQWDEELENPGSNDPGYFADTLEALKTIKYAIREGLLTQFKDAVFAEAYDDLQEQGRQLFDNGYILPASVIFRAVLEERLRKLCEHSNCVPQKSRIGINDYNLALYNSNIYDKTTMKHVDAMASVGNDAAHNLPLKKEDVERFMNDLPSFLARFSA